MNSTYRELATKEQMPTEPCNVHGDGRARIVRDLPDAGVPRAALAVDTAQVKAVPVKGATLLAENDPYNAVKSTVKPSPTPEEVRVALPVDEPSKKALKALKEPSEEEPILRAEPVEPRERETPEEIRRAEPVRRTQAVDPSDTALRALPVEPRDEDSRDN